MVVWVVVVAAWGGGGAGDANAWTSLSSGAWVDLGLPLDKIVNRLTKEGDGGWGVL